MARLPRQLFNVGNLEIMAMTVHCDIVSAEQSIFSGLVQLVVATGELGDLGIAPGHAPLLTCLKPGPVKIVHSNGEEEIYYTPGGYLEVQRHVVTVLSDSVVKAEDLDEASLLEAKRAAEKALLNRQGDFDYSKAAIELAEASAQLRTLQKLRNQLGR